jgi:hypothetical protein
MKKEKGIATRKTELGDAGDEALDSLRLYFQDIRGSQLLTLGGLRRVTMRLEKG